MDHQPNLFKYATSELSQDAFICWLLAWADEKYADAYGDGALICKVAIKLLDKFFEICKIEKPNEYHSVEIKRQYKNIDILVTINSESEKFQIIIEDKTKTKEHSEQLEKYRNEILKKLSKDHLLCIYLKTGDQLNFQFVYDAEYVPFLRKDLLLILNDYNFQDIKNNIFLDFRSHLQEIENKVSAFEDIEVKNWKYLQWTGFSKKLCEKLEVKGRFEFSGHIQIDGFYYEYNELKNCYFYLRFGFNNTLSFKLEMKKEHRLPGNITEIQDHIYKELVARGITPKPIKNTVQKKQKEQKRLTLIKIEKIVKIQSHTNKINIDETVQIFKRLITIHREIYRHMIPTGY